MVTLLMTLNDPEPPKLPHFYTLCAVVRAAVMYEDFKFQQNRPG